MIISFIAIPGAGKSTQIALLESSGVLEDAIAVSIPSLYRNGSKIVAFLTEDEKYKILQVKEESDSARMEGILAPFVLDEIVFSLAYRLHSMGKTVLMDGCPRGVPQAKLFLSGLNFEQRCQYKIIELVFPQDEITHSQTRQYNRVLKSHVEETEEAKLKIAKIPTKTSLFISETRQGLNYLKAEGISVISINATSKVTDIHKDVLFNIMHVQGEF